jgi:hypothetical protein
LKTSEAEVITQLYRGLLRREPDPVGLKSYADTLENGGELSEILDTVVHSPEFWASHRATVSSAFFHYNSVLDAQAIIRRHAVPNLTPTPGYLTNFLGVRIDPKFFPELTGRGGQLDGIPIPGNWHADIAEWAAALRAVDLARDRFTVIELGCGWGCWLNNTGVAARRAGLAVQLIGVEGDQGHIGFAREACATNDFSSDQLTLRRGIAAPTSGVALFPRQNQAGVNWGLEPVFGASEAEQEMAIAAGSHDVLPMIALADLTAPHSRIDLLHIDIQGGETNLIAGCLPTLAERVAYIFIGTHSRQIEGKIMEMLLAEGWLLEIERPAIFELYSGTPKTTADGAQGWRNPRLT